MAGSKAKEKNSKSTYNKNLDLYYSAIDFATKLSNEKKINDLSITISPNDNKEDSIIPSFSITEPGSVLISFNMKYTNYDRIRDSPADTYDARVSFKVKNDGIYPVEDNPETKDFISKLIKKIFK